MKSEDPRRLCPHEDTSPVRIQILDGETMLIQTIAGTLCRCIHCGAEVYRATPEWMHEMRERRSLRGIR